MMNRASNSISIALARRRSAAITATTSHRFFSTSICLSQRGGGGGKKSFEDDYDLFEGMFPEASVISSTPHRGHQQQQRNSQNDSNDEMHNARNGSSSSSSSTSSAKKHPKDIPSEIIIRNIPASWGKTEVFAFVMDALASEADPIELSDAFLETYVAETNATAAASSSDESAASSFTSIANTSFGTVTTVTDAYGVSVDEGVWYPIKKVFVLHSAKKGVTLRRAIVSFNPYPNMTGVIAPIRPNGQQTAGLLSDQTGANHPLVKKMLRINPEDVAPGINNTNKRFMGRQRLATGSGLVEIQVYESKRRAAIEHPDDYTQWGDRDRILWEANNTDKVLESLDIDRFLMSPDLLYDFERMKQKKYVAEADLQKSIAAAASGSNSDKSSVIGIKAFLPSAGASSSAPSVEEDMPEEGVASVGTEIGRGSPQNMRIAVPYVERL